MGRVRISSREAAGEAPEKERRCEGGESAQDSHLARDGFFVVAEQAGECRVCNVSRPGKEQWERTEHSGKQRMSALSENVSARPNCDELRRLKTSCIRAQKSQRAKNKG